MQPHNHTCVWVFGYAAASAVQIYYTRDLSRLGNMKLNLITSSGHFCPLVIYLLLSYFLVSPKKSYFLVDIT